ncbi:hypothetical protein ACET3Z_022148 [Daucus carota]
MSVCPIYKPPLPNLSTQLAAMLPYNISGHRTFLLLIALFFSALVLPATSDELQVLLKLKSNLENSNSHVFSTWSSENSPCNFTGIVCDTNQMVREINLPLQNLVGTVPFDAICSLESLEKVSLGNNSLVGDISDHLRNCTNLKYLDLGWNFFSGGVPDLSSLTKLEFLSLNLSGVSGSFPWKSLENLTSLSFLSLGDNLFEKNLFPLEILKLEKLYWLYLTNSSIEGQIPEDIGRLTLLEHLELSANFLFGKIPVGITKLTKLSDLFLYDNNLSGKFPVGFGNLSNLEALDASNNSLEGDISELKSLTNLGILQLFENQLSGEVPVEFGDFKFLREISLYSNRFTGSLPQKIGSWTDFQSIDVAENFFTGPIPPDMCKEGKMVDILLLQNNFTGEIPETYANCLTLDRFRVSNNSLSGPVPPAIWGLPNLSILDLAFNQFEGPVTRDIGQAKYLSRLFLAHNQFSGELPGTISDASSLETIVLSSNNFSGEIPSTVGELVRLSSFYLDGNNFSGAIPHSLGSCGSLNVLNLAKNSLYGEIPASLGYLQTLNSLNLSDNKLSGKIPESLSSSRLSLLDLSNNQLSGRIPDSISVNVFSESFVGNPGLCSDSGIRNLRPCASSSGNKMSIQSKVIVSCSVAGVFVLVLLLVALILASPRKNSENCPMQRRDSWDLKQYHILSFGEEEVVKALKQENVIGKGGCGSVYKVTLSCGKQLAVKHIWKQDSSGENKFGTTSPMLEKGKTRTPEYDAEVATLSSIRHVNVVKLYCSITSEDSHLLVYEFMPNGSLWDQLHTRQQIRMDWSVRYEIALGAARGLEYLHHGCDRPVIHRDVKSSNILLDENMKPRIADFGLAKVVQPNGLRGTTHLIAGTYGYIAPEYAYAYKVDEKSDVYSFGVVLMELVTGRRPTEPDFGDKDLVQWVCDTVMRSEEKAINLVDSTISDRLKEDAAKVLTIAIRCTIKIPTLRPSMKMVVHMLEDVAPYLPDEANVKSDGQNSRQ